MEKGNLSITSENMLPIIKKWLYSDSDIFIRELVSNGCDAISKLKKLVQMGEAEATDAEYRVDVTVDKDASIITVSDNGIGMTADEIKEYITNIAFSGASDFVEKYKDQMDDANDIIGHFGLGFYSAFMVADKVQIDSLSYKDGAKAARWICDGGIEYELGEESDRTQRGTTITLYIGEDGKDFLDGWKLREALTKYCYFMPTEIYFTDLVQERKDAEEAEKKAKESEDKSEEVVEPVKETPINETEPLYLKKPSDCTDEDYKKFYHTVFTDYNDPLFWIHLNMEYPFRLKGILYFPKLKHELEAIEGQVKLYNNQVFIADNLKEVIPEFLLLLKGTLDCPDLPLNVSRSFLQNDGYVTKISKYIVKKVADKLNSLFKKDREQYTGFWDNINQFIKYGCLREPDFYDKIKDSLIYKTTNGDYVTLTEYTDRNKEKAENKVFYVTDSQLQAQYVKLFKDNGMEAVELTTKLDTPFISYLEAYGSTGVTFARIDSATDMLKKKDAAEISEDEVNALTDLFKDSLGKEVKVKAEALMAEDVSAVIELSEQSRRMQEMSAMYGMDTSAFPTDETLVLNSDNGVVKLLLSIKDNADKKDEAKLICEQVYALATMSNKALSAEEMTAFIARSNKILEMLADK
jgi:molecular chaperone HtpG